MKDSISQREAKRKGGGWRGKGYKHFLAIQVPLSLPSQLVDFNLEVYQFFMQKTGILRGFQAFYAVLPQLYAKQKPNGLPEVCRWARFIYKA